MLNTGGPVLMPWLHHVEAVLQAWYPGQQFGAALAAVLFGDSDPGGRLPVTFPASDEQGPAPPTRPERYPGVNGEQRYDEGIFVGYRWYDQFRQQPLFPFGYGLSYARLPLRRPARARPTRRGTATTRVTNTSRRAGSTVAQAYLVLPAVGRGAAAPAQGVREGPARAGSQRGRHVPARPRRPGRTSTRARTGRSSPTAATRCRWGARRATCPRARASSWAATAIAESGAAPRLGSGAVSTTGRERGGYAKGRERRDAILAAANEVFATRGFRGASLATIAKRVGMSEPGLLHHFASKEELLLELLQLRDQHDDERIAEARAAHAHVLDVLLALCRQNEERPGIVRLFTILAAESVDDDHPAHDWFLPATASAARILVDRLANAQREGTIDADLDPGSVASQILAMFDGLQLQWLLDPAAST